jgi:hypothetical protein
MLGTVLPVMITQHAPAAMSMCGISRQVGVRLTAKPTPDTATTELAKVRRRNSSWGSHPPGHLRRLSAQRCMGRVTGRQADHDGLEPFDSRSEILLRQQRALQDEAAAVMAELDLSRRLACFGPAYLTGSFVSGLMVWRELDIMFLGGPELSPTDVLAGLTRLVVLPGIVGFEYVDERGNRSPTGQPRDERFHVAVTYLRSGESWRLDLTFWLHDAHENVTAWHQNLRDSLTAEQREAILWIKDVWCRRDEYPGSISGVDIYQAVLEHDVRTPAEFQRWLTRLQSG